MTPPSAKPETAAPDESSTPGPTDKVSPDVAAPASQSAADNDGAAGRQNAGPDAAAKAKAETASGAESVTHLRPIDARKGVVAALPPGGMRPGMQKPQDQDQSSAAAQDGAARPGQGPGQGLGPGQGPGAGPGRGRPMGAGPGPGPQGGPGPAGRPAMLMRQRKAQEDQRLALLADEDATPHSGQNPNPNKNPNQNPGQNPGQNAEAKGGHPGAGAAQPHAQAPQPQRGDQAEAPAPQKAPPAKPQANPGKVHESPFANYIPAPTARGAKMRQRHWGLVAAFMLLVLLPSAFTTWYMYTRAADQYESNVGFGSRTENAPTTFSILGAFGMGGGSSSGDMDILYQFMSSQELVTRVDKKLDLRKLYSKPQNDPLLSFPADGSIEDLVRYWSKMVVPYYDGSTGLMTVKVYAFEPQDAQNIASAVLQESTSIINELSQTAQVDATRYGKEALEKAQAGMADTQRALTAFRIKNNIVDPTDQLQGAGMVVNSLIQQLGAAEIDLDLLVGTVPDSDPRIAGLNRRIEVIQKRIAAEQSKVGGLADPNSAGYANLVADYQSLQMSSDFAQKAYLTALGAYDQALNDAQHKTRYLATFVQPTLAESSGAPDRPLWIFFAALIGFLAWATLAMIYYALRDRR
ncbi:MAG: hypothetical protein ACOH2H_18450 [Cypionkella sp.]